MLSRWAPLTAVLAVCAPAATVRAAEGWQLDEHRPATWDDAPSQLESAGLGQSRGNPVVPDKPLSTGPRTSRAGLEPTVLFLNFDGAELTSGPDDARSNLTTINNMAGPYPAYGENGAKRQAVMQAVREDWSAYNAVVTDRRPDSGDYVMAMIGPGNPDNDSKLGIAVLDCGDARTRNNVVFAFHSSGDSHTATSTATTISQEIGHSVGLEHVDQASDIMNPTNVGGDPSFRDECLPLSQRAECPAQHDAECGSVEQQNAHRELYELMGPATPDASGPSIELIAPLDGENFDLDERFEIVIDADDGFTVHKAALFVNTVLENTDDAAPFGWTATQSTSGEYELRVEVQDTQGFIRVSNTVTVTVGRTSPLGGSDALPPSTSNGAPGEPEGCGCRTGSESGTLPIWAVVVALGIARRRRRLRF
ncbi:MAG: Ig-like domain-containing protein [Nannocystales bacterium]